MLKSEIDVITIRADGSYVKTTDVKMQVANEAGKMHLALTRIPYSPQYSKIKVISGSTSLNTPGSEIHHLNLGRIEDREIGSKDHGISSARELILPFTELTNNSLVSYTYQEQSVKVRTPGVFTASMTMGNEIPELSEEVILKSETPLRYKTNSPDALLVTEGRDGNLYTLDIKLKNATYSVVKNEPLAVYTFGSGIRVDISTADSWNQLARGLAEKYNSEIDKKLPPVFTDIAKGAQALKTWDDKIDYVVNNVSSKITYVGFWTAEKGMYLPRGHQEVASTKTGDCKDFASTTAGILRSLGLKADVALVNAAKPYDSYNREPVKDKTGDLPTLDYFNHAIVRVELPEGGGVRWIDPTQLATYPGGVFPEIAGASALTLTASTTDLEVIPEDSVAADIEIKTVIDVATDHSAQESTNFVTKGPDAVSYKIAARLVGARALESQVAKALLHKRKELRATTASVDSSQPGVVTGVFDISTESALNKEGTAYTVDYNPRWLALNFADKKRVTNLYLGSRGHTRTSTLIRGVQGTDDARSDCYVLSPWMDLRRNVSLAPGGISVEDELVVKKSVLTVDEIKGDEFGSFARNLNNCITSPTVAVKNTAVATSLASKQDSIEISKSTLADAIAILELTGPARYHRSGTARKILEHVLEVSPRDAEARSWLASAILNLGYISGEQWEPSYLKEALRQASLAIESNPNSATARRTRSTIALHMGDRATALRDFDVAYKIDPTNLKNFVIGANLAKNAKDNTSAEQWLSGYTRAAKTPTDSEDAYTKLGGFYLAIEQNQKSANAYDAAIKINPKNAWLWHNRALALWQLPGRLNDAIDSEKKALAITDFGAARWHLASLYLAKVAFTLKLASNPKAPPPTSEQEKEIEGWLIEANAFHPDSVEALIASADYYRLLGTKHNDQELLKKAADYYARVIKIDGSHFLATEGLYELHNKGVKTIPLDNYNRVPASELRKQHRSGTAAPPENYPDKPYQFGDHVLTGPLSPPKPTGTH